MPDSISHVTVFCASSRTCDPYYYEAATRLGELLANEGLTTVYGGGLLGCMGHLANGALTAGGKVVGYIPHFMHKLEWHHTDITELNLVETMSERKDKLIGVADAIVTLPGGSGTIEEFFDALTAKRLGHFTGPLVIVNLENFYDPMIELLNDCIKRNFMAEIHGTMWSVVDSIDAVPQALLDSPPWNESHGLLAGV